MIRTLGLLAVVVLLSLTAQAQENNAPEKQGPPSIELKLSSRSLMGCVGSSLPLELEISNRGNETYKVDKVDIWNHFTYGFLNYREAACGGGQGSDCSHCRGDFVFVRPNEFYQSSFSFDLKSDFFRDAGKYEIRLTIDGVASNKIEFELFSCE